MMLSTRRREKGSATIYSRNGPICCIYYNIKCKSRTCEKTYNEEAKKQVAGCQLKTFKTFILMVKPLKPLFFSEKPLKTFILDNKPLFSGKAGFHVKLIVKV